MYLLRETLPEVRRVGMEVLPLDRAAFVSVGDSCGGSGFV
jgi:hypothetical protein